MEQVASEGFLQQQHCYGNGRRFHANNDDPLMDYLRHPYDPRNFTPPYCSQDLVAQMLPTDHDLIYNNQGDTRLQFLSRNDSYGMRNDYLLQQYSDDYLNDVNDIISRQEDSESSKFATEFLCETCGILLHSLDELQLHREHNHSSLRNQTYQMHDLRPEPASESHSENSHHNNGSLTNDLTSGGKMEDKGNSCESMLQYLENLQSHGLAADPNSEMTKTCVPKTPVHGEKSTPEPNRIFRCDPCRRSFKKQCYLTQHINARHSVLRVHQCQKCKKKFVTVEELDAHYAKHSAKGRFACSEENCDKSFHYKCDLQRHTRLHTKDLHYCSNCDRGFMRLTHLEDHSKQHSKETKETKGKKVSA